MGEEITYRREMECGTYRDDLPLSYTENHNIIPMFPNSAR